MYLPKLHENILKYYRLNLFKEIRLASTMVARWLWNLLQAFLMVFLFDLLNPAIILAFCSSLVLLGVLLVSCSTMAQHTIIKGIAFSQSILDSLSCVAWCRVLLLDIGSSSSHYLLQGLDVLNLKPCGKMNGGRMSLSLVINPNTIMWTLYFVIIIIVRREQPNGCYSLSSPFDPGRYFSHLRKNKACSIEGDAWVGSKTL